MEKMNDKVANKIFNEIDNRWEETLKLTYGEDKIPVEAYCHIPVTAIETVANLVAELSCENNSFDYIKCKENHRDSNYFFKNIYKCRYRSF